MARTTNFAEVIKKKLATDPELAAKVKDQALIVSVAEQIYSARKDAGLSQAELARLTGSKQSVISRIEDADYDGHSLATLRRIAAALNKDLRIEFVARPVPNGGGIPGRGAAAKLAAASKAKIAGKNRG